jgi:hypothetical protein
MFLENLNKKILNSSLNDVMSCHINHVQFSIIGKGKGKVIPVQAVEALRVAGG